MKLTPQQKQIFNLLADAEWHCLNTPSFFMKDDRKRISELNVIGKAEGFEIIGEKCNGKCGVNHTSPVKMRKLVKREIVSDYCCNDMRIFKQHFSPCKGSVKLSTGQLNLSI